MCRDRELVPVSVGGVAVDVCRACEGVWLQKGELERLLALEVREVLASQAAVVWYGAPPEDRADRAGGLDCPECASPLRCRSCEGAEGIFVDGCVRGCGLWVDDGELRRIYERVCGGKSLAVDRPGLLRGAARQLLGFFGSD